VPNLSGPRPNACDPLADEAGVLTCREATVIAATGEWELARPPAGQSETLIDGLLRLSVRSKANRRQALPTSCDDSNGSGAPALGWWNENRHLAHRANSFATNANASDGCHSFDLDQKI
jgi:hypothetical protein